MRSFALAGYAKAQLLHSFFVRACYIVVFEVFLLSETLWMWQFLQLKKNYHKI